MRRTFALISHEGLPGLTLHADNIADCANLLRTYNERLNYSVFETVNVTDGIGRSRENITHLRGLYADFDTGIKGLGECTVQPTVLVCSSPEKFQAYWLFPEPLTASPDLSLEYLGTQAALVKKLGADEKARDLTRVLRVPGFMNRKPKYKSSPPRVYKIHDTGPRYPLAILREYFGYIEPAQLLFNQGQASTSLAEKAGHEKAVMALHKAIATKPPPASQRNEWAYRTACFGLVQLGLDEEAVYEVLDDYVGDMEGLERTVKNAAKYATRAMSYELEREIDL